MPGHAQTGESCDFFNASRCRLKSLLHQSHGAPWNTARGLGPAVLRPHYPGAETRRRDSGHRRWSRCWQFVGW